MRAHAETQRRKSWKSARQAGCCCQGEWVHQAATVISNAYKHRPRSSIQHNSCTGGSELQPKPDSIPRLGQVSVVKRVQGYVHRHAALILGVHVRILCRSPRVHRDDHGTFQPLIQTASIVFTLLVEAPAKPAKARKGSRSQMCGQGS